MSAKQDTQLRYVAQYTPDVYEVIHPTRERIGCVQRYGRREWVAYPNVGLSREFTTRREAGRWVKFESERR